MAMLSCKFRARRILSSGAKPSPKFPFLVPLISEQISTFISEVSAEIGAWKLSYSVTSPTQFEVVLNRHRPHDRIFTTFDCVVCQGVEKCDCTVAFRTSYRSCGEEYTAKVCRQFHVRVQRQNDKEQHKASAVLGYHMIDCLVEEGFSSQIGDFGKF